MSTEIVINKKILKVEKTKMSNLSSKVFNKNLELSFSKSKGKTVDELKRLAEQLISLQSSLVLLYSNTEKAIGKTLTEFEKNDNEIANYFKFMEKIEK